MKKRKVSAEKWRETTMAENKLPVSNGNDNFVVDKQIEILLKEFETIRAESNGRENSRMQITSAAAALIVALTALSPLLISTNAKGAFDLKVPVAYLIIMLLIISFIFISLQMAYLSQDVEVGNIALRVKSIREALCELLQLDMRTTPILKWDIEHIEMLNPTARLERTGSIVMSVSRYVLFAVPALAFLIISANVYFFNVHQLSTVEGIASISFFFIDLAYFLLTLPCALFSYRTYLKLRKPSKQERGEGSTQNPSQSEQKMIG
jgi:hypothetical protein